MARDSSLLLDSYYGGKLASELDPSHGEEESAGHVPTFQLSPGRNAHLFDYKSRHGNGF